MLYDIRALDASPLVSCVMPSTAARAHLIPHAIACFDRQTYPHKELVILTDGPPLEIAVRRDPDIRHLYRELSFDTLGEKRNFLNSFARGALICHWDDDDHSAPHRLALQVATFLSGTAKVCGLRSMYFVCQTDRSVWRYTYPPHTPGVVGTSAMYRKSYWEMGSWFPARATSEDSLWFIERKATICEPPDDRIVVAVDHGANTVVRTYGGQAFQRVTDVSYDELVSTAEPAAAPQHPAP